MQMYEQKEYAHNKMYEIINHYSPRVVQSRYYTSRGMYFNAVDNFRRACVYHTLNGFPGRQDTYYTIQQSRDTIDDTMESAQQCIAAESEVEHRLPNTILKDYFYIFQDIILREIDGQTEPFTWEQRKIAAGKKRLGFRMQRVEEEITTVYGGDSRLMRDDIIKQMGTIKDKKRLEKLSALIYMVITYRSL
jgi:hypothetical protein